MDKGLADKKQKLRITFSVIKAICRENDIHSPKFHELFSEFSPGHAFHPHLLLREVIELHVGHTVL